MKLFDVFKRLQVLLLVHLAGSAFPHLSGSGPVDAVLPDKPVLVWLPKDSAIVPPLVRSSHELLLLKKHHEKKGDYAGALRIYEKYVALKDSLRALSAPSVIVIPRPGSRYFNQAHRLQLQSKQQRINALENERRYQRIRYMAVLVAGCCLMGAGIYFYRRQLRRHHREQQQAQDREALRQSELEAIRRKEQQLQRTLDLKSQELSQYAINFIQKNEVLSRFRHTLKETRNLADNQQVSTRIHEMQRLIDQVQSVDKDWEEFMNYFGQLHPRFYEELTRRFPHLTTNDLKLCALIKINRNLKESSAVLGVSTESIKIARYRLRKKLNLGKEENLTQFIRHIGTEEHPLALQPQTAAA